MFYFIGPFGRQCFGKPTKLDKSNIPSLCTDDCLKEAVNGQLQCNCGEEYPIFDWSWSEEYHCTSALLSKDNKEILFHPAYSSGTAAVKGQFCFKKNHHYYWEVKMISKMYGTDVMVGVGTSKVDVSDWKFRFCSVLGIDANSWGYSYHGEIQHDSVRAKYGSNFGLGSIVGVHLDMCKGTLEYYLNRKPQGIAFTDLRDKELFPMVSSTAAQSAVRITCAVTEQPTLQMMCLEFIMKYPCLYKQYRKIPGLTRQYDRQYFWMVPRNEPDEKKRLADLDEDLTLSLVDKSYLNDKNKRFKGLLFDFSVGNLNSDDDDDSIDEFWVDGSVNISSSDGSDINTSSNNSQGESSDTQSGSSSMPNSDESQNNVQNEEDSGSFKDVIL